MKTVRPSARLSPALKRMISVDTVIKISAEPARINASTKATQLVTLPLDPKARFRYQSGHPPLTPDNISATAGIGLSQSSHPFALALGLSACHVSTTGSTRVTPLRARNWREKMRPCKPIGDARIFPGMMECIQRSMVEAKRYRDVPLPLVRKGPAPTLMIPEAAAVAVAAAAQLALEAFILTVAAPVRGLVQAVKRAEASSIAATATKPPLALVLNRLMNDVWDASKTVLNLGYLKSSPSAAARKPVAGIKEDHYIISSTTTLPQSQFRSESTVGFDNVIGQEKEKQERAPWHREGSNVPPVKQARAADAMTKGKLLTTPSRLLKLVVPLTTLDKNSEPKDIEPLALLVHPQQPLSYLERLIQSELPAIENDKGEEKIPHVYFRAEDSQQDVIEPKTPGKKTDDSPEDMHEHADQDGDLEETMFDGKMEKTGKLSKEQEQEEHVPKRGLGEGSVESYSGAGREGAAEGGPKKFVRWSPSTEIGDFIRDAARGKEFAIEIEGASNDIRVGVPSFNDRTHYLRLRLRKTASKIVDMAALKKECDMAAHKGAQRVAVAGAGLLYLVGLSTLICGYLWFLYHNREVSYRSALNLTISRRQTKLYQAKGFDLQRWESLIEEANGYRKEIKQIASEYDVDWDETQDEKDERVTKAMKKVRSEKQAKRKQKDDKDEDGDDDD
ncbi:MAG: hypothetical protein Q9217_004512 [Psora testacea]